MTGFPSNGFRLPRNWPRPADPAAGIAFAEAIWAAPGGNNPLPIRRDPATAAMLCCLGGNSSFLSGLCRRERDFLAELLRDGPAAASVGALGRLGALRPDQPRTGIRAGLRQARRQVALATAIADLGGIWSLERVTGTLSLLAEAALRVSVAHLLHESGQAGQIRLPDPEAPERDSGFVVLAMGKLGALELNYSSDIDLVLLHDPGAHPDTADAGRVFNRMAADLVSLMEARDADGYVFRTDLRLRPDPGATPPAVSLPAAISYYESSGRTWERAAMIKARPVAGDLECGARFLQAIRPFVWRRHLDFAAIDDIHAMKRRIDQHKPAPARGFPAGTADPVSALLDHDLKLGHGGIREIEFVAQTLQLVWAGRDPTLRDPTTLGALARLAEAGLLKRTAARSLCASYRRLRGLEHRLQMQEDRQTHSLPATRAGFETFAGFAGAADGTTLAASLLPELRRTRRRFDHMAGSRAARSGAGSAEFPFDGADAAERLRALGFADGVQARAILGRWQTDRYRALRQPRARALLEGLAPVLLRALAAQRDPLAALNRFDTLLSRQNSGVQLLSLFDRSPALLVRIAGLLGAAPFLADHLAAVPGALDGLLVPDPDRRAARALRDLLDRQMGAAVDVEDAIRAARPLVRAEEFRLAVAQLENRIGADAAGLARTALAERVINGLLRHVEAAHRQRHGIVPGGVLAVVALGKAGSRDAMSGSDLDLMLVYDHPNAVTESVAGPEPGPGPAPGARPVRPLPPSQFFLRLAHALVAALTAPGVEGPLYAVDMRLRPSGAKGPVAVSLSAFRRYHAEQAWTWERMALLRARVVAGRPAARRPVRAAIGAALSAAPPGPDGRTAGQRLRDDARAMRARLARDLPPQGPWDVRRRPGGLMEVEFIAQVLQLACPDPAVRHPATRIALRRLGRAGMLSAGQARTLIGADRFWRQLQGLLRILLGSAVPRDLGAVLPAPAMEALLDNLSRRDPALSGLDAPSGLDALRRRCEEVAASVRSLFEQLVGPLDDPEPPPEPGP